MKALGTCVCDTSGSGQGLPWPLGMTWIHGADEGPSPFSAQQRVLEPQKIQTLESVGRREGLGL